MTYREYLDALRKADLPLNTAAMIGTGTAKICVKNFSDTPYTEEELEKTEALIEDALAQGAPAISLGIMKLLDRINRAGTTVVMATHDREMVDSMRKRVIALEAGQVVRDQERGGYGFYGAL